jgi:hypothetical protein
LCGRTPLASHTVFEKCYSKVSVLMPSCSLEIPILDINDDSGLSIVGLDVSDGEVLVEDAFVYAFVGR